MFRSQILLMVTHYTSLPLDDNYAFNPTMSIIMVYVKGTMIRLMDGDSDQSGRVEIFAQGNWGSISDTGFDRRDLQVICSMLGYEFR